MKQLLLCLATMLLLVACTKQYTDTPRSKNSVQISNVSTFDDLFVDAISLGPVFHKADSGVVTTVYQDSFWTQFGGDITHIEWQFSNANISYRGFKILLDANTVATGVTTTTINGIKTFVFDDPTGNALNLTPGWHYVKLRCKLNGTSGQNCTVTIASGGITYENVDVVQAAVVGLPQTTPGAGIK